MEDRFELFKHLRLITSPDQISVDEWMFHGNVWCIGYGVYKETYFYIGIPILNLKDKYYA